MAENYTSPLPPKLNQNRGASGGYARQPLQAGSPRTSQPQAAKTTLQPPGSAAPTAVDASPDLNQLGQQSDENGFTHGPLPSNPDDAQSQQCDQPDIDIDIAAPPVVPTTEEPPTTEASDPTPGDADPGATGAAESPGYAGLTEQSHPRGYPGN